MEKEFIEILKKDYREEYFGRNWYMWLERLFFNKRLKAQFKELSERKKNRQALLKMNLKSIT